MIFKVRIQPDLFYLVSARHLQNHHILLQNKKGPTPSIVEAESVLKLV